LSTALVCLAAAGREAAATHYAGRPRADFLAQLIAVAVQAPQARARRRAEPQEATAAYRALSSRPAHGSCVVSRSL